MPDAQLLIPDITDQDIDWVRTLMRLDALDAPRRAFLTARATLDVSACPGSGKTTLVVAKLAILARKWPHRTRGICVLSHTNVAREEVQRRLGCTVVGHRLLSYPHFIDTIHSFVNRFAALPWLRANGYPSPIVDDNVTTAYRRGALSPNERYKLQHFLEQRHSGLDQLRVCARDLSFDLGGKPFPAGPNAVGFKSAKKALTASAQAGYFCHDEMFVWARALLEDFPEAASWLRRRFPLLLVDEMQDTLDVQNAMLSGIFPRASAEVVVQRLGDPNQAIFGDPDTDTDSTHGVPGPGPAQHLGIPTSYRFGPEIAAFASPFAVTPVGAQGLCGHGPKAILGASAKYPHTVFVFADDSTAGVLDAYGKLVLTSFDDGTLAESEVTAVGAVHKDASTIQPGHDHFPKTVPHYWTGYTAEISRKESHPGTLVQYARAAQAAVRDGHELSPGVERIGLGLVRLACRIGDAGQLKGRNRTHRVVVSALERTVAALAAYRLLVKRLLIDWIPLSETNWSTMKADALAIAVALCEGVTDQTKATDFLGWQGDDPSPSVPCKGLRTDAGPNTYRFTDGDRHVDIRLGSIHSVKGQTHLATMLLDTYWHAHSSQQMLPWLLGVKINESGAGVRDRRRLLQSYVAMTRPSHLLCIAVRRSTFGDDPAFAQHIQTMSDRGWRVAEIVSGTAQWRA